MGPILSVLNAGPRKPSVSRSIRDHMAYSHRAQ
jgi:hypothetical protein